MYRAFTLIELLVVITIVVVLLALLTPALDKAIYQAEMAVCASNVKAICSGVQIYAIENGRAYPHRPYVDGGTAVEVIKWGTPPQNDTRLHLLPYMSMKPLLDPFSAQVSFDMEEVDAESHIQSNYTPWFGYGYIGMSKMARLGDRTTWTENGQTDRYNILVSDYDLVTPSYPNAYNEHPDDRGVLAFEAGQNMDSWHTPGPIGGATGNRWTFSRWANWANYNRGLVDNNYGYIDGSVQRFDRVSNGDPGTNQVDERMGKVGGWSAATETAGQWTHLPRR